MHAQTLKMCTEAIFCPILKIKIALESWDSIRFKKVKIFFIACILYADQPKYGGKRFWPFCVQNARKKKIFNIFGKYGVSAF